MRMSSRDGDIERADIGYLAGIIDGEGCLSIAVAKREDSAFKLNIKPILNITNTDRKLIEAVQTILGKLGIKNRVSRYHAAPNRRSDGYRIHVTSPEELARILPVLIPYLISKRRRAELILAYVLKRRRKLRMFKSGSKQSRYGPEEFSMAERIRNEIALSSGKTWSRHPRTAFALRQLMNQSLLTQ